VTSVHGGYRGICQSAVAGVDVITALIVFFHTHPIEPLVFMYRSEHIFPAHADRTEGDVMNHWADVFAGFV